MTVSSEVNRVAYAGDGATTVFSLPFYFLDNEDILAYSYDPVTGVTITLVYGSDYLLSNAFFVLVHASTNPVGKELIIIRNPNKKQTVDYVENDKFPAETHERAIDKLTMLIQRLSERIDRALRFPDTDSAPSPDMPSVAERTGRVLGFGPGGVPEAVELSGNFIDLSTSNGAGLVGWIQNAVSAVARTVKQKLFEIYSPDDFGIIGLGNDAAIIQTAFDKMPTGATIRFDSRKTYDLNGATVTFSVKRGRMTGGGIIKGGTVKVRHPDYITDADRWMEFSIDGLCFEGTTGLEDAIRVIDVSMGSIKNCFFRGMKTCIAVPVNADTLWGQVAQKLEIAGNTYNNVSYFVKGESSAPGITYGLADSIVSKNRGIAAISHVNIDSVDGLTITDNIFFGDLSAGNGQIIYVKHGAWIQIHDNKLFEPGKESIKLENCIDIDIHDNFHAWPGQKVISPCISIIGSPDGGDYFTFGTISHEHIHRPSDAGIVVAAKNGRMIIDHNRVFFPGDNDRYSGAPGVHSTDAVQLAADTLYITTDHNHGMAATYALPDGGAAQTHRHTNNYREYGGKVYRSTHMSTANLVGGAGAEVTYDVGPWDEMAFAQVGANNFTGFTNSANDSKYIDAQFFNGNTTFINSGTLAMRGGVNVTPVFGQFIRFRVDTAGNTKEVSRNF